MRFLWMSDRMRGGSWVVHERDFSAGTELFGDPDYALSLGREAQKALNRL